MVTQSQPNRCPGFGNTTPRRPCNTLSRRFLKPIILSAVAKRTRSSKCCTDRLSRNASKVGLNTRSKKRPRGFQNPLHCKVADIPAFRLKDDVAALPWVPARGIAVSEEADQGFLQGRVDYIPVDAVLAAIGHEGAA